MNDETMNQSNEGKADVESPSSMSILTNMVSAPSKAFKDIQVAYPIMLPLSLVIIVSVIALSSVFGVMDYQWYTEQMVQATAADMSKAEQDQVRQGMEMMASVPMHLIMPVFAIIGTLIMFCLWSVYLIIVSNITNDGFQFKQWFSFVCWTSIPALVSGLASIVMTLTNTDGHISAESMNPLSLNALFFHMSPFAGLGKVFATMDITQIWSVALMTIGYSQWTGKSKSAAFGIVIIPLALYYGVSFFLA